MLGNIGPLEIGIVLVIALIVFGPKRLPELGSGMGRGMREFKEGISGSNRNDPEAIGSSEGTDEPTAAKSEPAHENSG